MSTQSPIPVRLRDKFIAHMVASDFDDMPDGAWFYTLEQAAEQFMRQHKLPGGRFVIAAKSTAWREIA